MDLYLLLCKETRISPERRGTLLQSVQAMKDRRVLERRAALAAQCCGSLSRPWYLRLFPRATAVLLMGSALFLAGVRLFG